MARRKQNLWQRSFVYMEMREDFLERDDLDVRGQSLQSALNMKGLATGALESRDGLLMERALPGVDRTIEVRPDDEQRFGLALTDTSLQILDENANIAFTDSSVGWSDASALWVAPYREKTLIGDDTGIWVLTYSDSTWALAEFSFADGTGGEIAQPYWSYEQSASIQPSAVSGSISVTASAPIWTSNYVGQRVRYGGREIQITSFISSTVLQGDVVNQLPPSFDVEVQDASEFRVGDAVVGADTNYQGLVVGVSGSTVSVATQSFFEGPDVGEELASPGGSSEVVTVTTIAPVSSPIWDEPLFSPKRGYPRAAAQVSGRLVLLDFAAIPDLIAMSSARSIEDFEVGAEDDDAIVRQVGDNAPRWLHAVNMGDLILLSDRGVYNVPSRENGVISPSTFNPVLIDDTGSSTVRPVKVEDGVIFVDRSGRTISAVFLDGNIYLKWSVKKVSTYHSHLIKSPTQLCGPALGSDNVEKYLYVINSDGTVAAVNWQESLRDEAVGFAPWTTQGNFVSISPLFDGYWAIVDRSIDGTTTRFLERFSSDLYVDCGVVSDADSDTTATAYLQANGADLEVNGSQLIIARPAALHLAGESAAYYAQGWDMGDLPVASDGSVDPGVEISGERQIGFNFEAELQPWPGAVVDGPDLDNKTIRVLRALVSVQNTLAYEVRCNNTTNQVPAIRFGDDLESPPETRTEIRRFAIIGSRDHPEIVIGKRRPGPFRVLAVGQRVQY